MISTLLVTFREALEVALIIAIVLRLAKESANFIKLKKTVYFGLAAGLAGSGIAGFLFYNLNGVFTGRAEQIFEGTVLLLGAATLICVVMWLKHEQVGSGQLNQKAKQMLEKEEWWGMFLLIFLSVLRDGVETVLYLGAAGATGGLVDFGGAFLGIGSAGVIGYLVYLGSKKINIKKLFTITSYLLIAFALSLVVRALEEFNGAGLIRLF